MLPIGDQPEKAEGRVERHDLVPFVTYGLVALNVLVLVYQLTLPPVALRAFFLSWGVVPAAVVAGEPRALLALLTAMFIHAGLIHLLSNMIFLLVFGDDVERAFGHWTYLGFYLVAGIAASLSQVAVYPTSTVPLIGASGAVAGVLAGYLLLFPRAPVRLLVFVGPLLFIGRAAALLIIGAWIVLQFVLGFQALDLPEETVGVAYFAHIGGFVTGAILTLIIRSARGEHLGSFSRGFLAGPYFRNWLLLIGAFLAAIAIGALVAGTSPVLGAVLQLLAIGAAGLVALFDGLARLAGRPSLLGPGRGIGRALAALQALAGLGILIEFLVIAI